MKTKKSRYIGAGLACLWLINVYEAKADKIVIHNQSGDHYTQAAIRIGAGNHWIPIGSLEQGEHILDIEAENNDPYGILRLKAPNGKCLVGVFKRQSDHQPLHINLLKDEVNKGIGLYTEASGQTFMMKALRQKFNNAWAAYCLDGYVGIGSIQCVIGSDPSIIFDGFGWGLSVNFTGISFASDLTPGQLVGLGTVNYGGGGLLYLHIDWRDQNGTLVAWANGGGFIAGGGNGKGWFSFKD